MSQQDSPWKADVRLAPAEAGAMARAAFDLSCRRVELLGEGWDFINYMADGNWVLRFPKRENCDAVLVREKEILDRLHASSLPVPVPFFEHLGEPNDDFPWHFAAYRYLPGIPLSELPSPASLQDIPTSIGRFLAELHQITTEAELANPWDAGIDDWSLQEFEASASVYPDDVRKRVESFLQQPPTDEPDLPRVLVHADLTAEHILVNPRTGQLTGVIDWADAYTSIRSSDYAGLYFMGGRNYTLRAYSAAGVEPEESEWQWLERAAVAMCIGRIHYGWKDKRPTLVTETLEKIVQFLP